MRNEKWSRDEIGQIYDSPLITLIHRAAVVHAANFDPSEIQVSSLISIKTGGCTEDCGYCPQSARYNTEIKVHGLMKKDEVVDLAVKAKEEGASRVCLGAAWREVRNNRDFDTILEMVSEINSLGMEVCCTLGMLTDEQASRLAEAGLFAYNHNVDTSESYYDKVITTRTYQDRLNTLDKVRKAGITVCSGGIIGLGESRDDRIDMIFTLASLPVPPESVPINTLVPVSGTPMENYQRVPVWDLLRMIATVRIVMPGASIRLSAGRTELDFSEQALCFLAGANSIFAGDKLLTTPNNELSEDHEMFRILGLVPREPFKDDPRIKKGETVLSDAVS